MEGDQMKKTYFSFNGNGDEKKVILHFGMK